MPRVCDRTGRRKDLDTQEREIGRGEETRTPGLLLPKQVRYQLRYSPRSKIVPRVTSGNGLVSELSRRTIKYRPIS